MSSKNDGISEFIGCIPHEIQAGWDEKYAPMLAGFPVNLVFTRILQPNNKNEPPQVLSSVYRFAVGTFHENAEERRVNYHSHANPTFRVVVVIHRRNSEIVVSKFNGENLLWEASGASFDGVMAHATMMGMEADELEDAP